MPEPIMAQFKTEGEPAFEVENTGNDNPADSPTEKTTNEQTQTVEGDENATEDTEPVVEAKPDTEGEKKDTENLANHPRWKERESDWKDRFNEQEKRHSDELAKLREDIEKQISEKKIGPKKDDLESPDEIPEWFGGDKNQWVKFKSWNDQMLKRVQDEAKKTNDERTESEKKAVKDATDFMNSEITTIESDKTLNPDGLKINREKLFKTVSENSLVDLQGRWNYRAAWKIMRASVKSSNIKNINEKKKLASATTSEKRSEPDKPDFVTSEDFENNPQERPW
jgi:hypothetical protein